LSLQAAWQDGEVLSSDAALQLAIRFCLDILKQTDLRLVGKVAKKLLL